MEQKNLPCILLGVYIGAFMTCVITFQFYSAPVTYVKLVNVAKIDTGYITLADPVLEQNYTPGAKYFFELDGKHPHLDADYGRLNLKPDMIRTEIAFLLKEFSRLCRMHRIEPIVMHGSLIGWYWNKRMLPWDDDIDIALLGQSIGNMNFLHMHETDELVIKVNPNSASRSRDDRDNVIDARVISKRNGAFIDITFLTDSGNLKPPGFINCKSPHFYNIDDILPLQNTTFEDISVFVPRHIEKVLELEYGSRALQPHYKNWVFKEKIWVQRT